MSDLVREGDPKRFITCKRRHRTQTHLRRKLRALRRHRDPHVPYQGRSAALTDLMAATSLARAEFAPPSVGPRSEYPHALSRPSRERMRQLLISLPGPTPCRFARAPAVRASCPTVTAARVTRRSRASARITRSAYLRALGPLGIEPVGNTPPTRASSNPHRKALAGKRFRERASG